MVQARAELWRALGSLAEAAASERSEAAAALGLPGAPERIEHTEILLLEVHPYASVYLGPEGMLGGEAADRVAGFWRALGMSPPSEPDHLASLCGLYAALLDEEAKAQERHLTRVRHARRSLLSEHILPWVPLFAHKVGQVAQGALGAWSTLLLEALEEEAREAGVPDRLPLHLREAPAGLGSVAGGNGEVSAAKELTAHLLSPVRTGMVLARSDLTGAARRLGLGLRLGERRFTLLALLEQDPVGVLGWLAQQAAEWGGFHASVPDRFGPSGSFFERRARECELFLRCAQRDAAEAVGKTSAGEPQNFHEPEWTGT